MVRYWLKNVYSKTLIGSIFCRLYRRYGERVAKQVRERRQVRSAVSPLFSWFLLKAQEA
jgi:hypothetical protein